jgi:hypothetical protein
MLYTQFLHDNRREVSLAHDTKKSRIPLNLDTNMTWPPERMGVFFTGLLYINFCNPNEDIQNDWNCQQFDDLVDSIRQRLTPEPDAATAALQQPSAPPVNHHASLKYKIYYRNSVSITVVFKMFISMTTIEFYSILIIHV